MYSNATVEDEMHAKSQIPGWCDVLTSLALLLRWDRLLWWLFLLSLSRTTTLSVYALELDHVPKFRHV